jgi:hypothetical protein
MTMSACNALGCVYRWRFGYRRWWWCEFTLHRYLSEHVRFGAFAVIPLDRYRMVTFVAGTFTAPITSDVVRPADSYIIHIHLH